MSTLPPKKKNQKKRANEQEGLMSNGGVKSKAVVKFTTTSVPTPFLMLQSNTNLNLPPPNWLTNAVAMYGVPSKIQTRSGFSSFSMASRFPDCVGKVDVVADSENVKKLLKMGYCPGPISLLVHRVGKTLLIDDFDVKQVLLASDNRWEMFHKLFESKQVKPRKVIEFKKNSRTVLQTKNLTSKFLYHSFAQPDETTPPAKESHKKDPNVPIRLESEPRLPEAKLEEELPDSESRHTFTRNVIWTFEDIQMLLGTDIPIFGGGTHPCISLKLRDSTKPLNVLTGMDYWLDNLMCNVPEVILCYHLNGIVQRYELIKTEDIPHLPNSKFSPKVVRDIAQNILSFLKSNATKSGHTYWLFKGHGDEVVKLYDLTSLCGDILHEGQTPFTIPVAMLLYRVARNMRHHDGRRQAATIATLLENCVALMPKDKFPEITTSAHYMLADVYIPSDLDPRKPDLNEPGTEATPNTEPEPDNYAAISSMNLTDIWEPVDEPPASPPPATVTLSSKTDTRCFDCLRQVLHGFRLLTKITTTEPEMSNPSEPIPMPCGTPEKNPKMKKSEEKSPIAIHQKVPVNNLEVSWPEHFKILLFEKAAMAYITLSQYVACRDDCGASLRYASIAIRLFKLLQKSRRPILRWHGFLYGRAGDTLVTLTARTPLQLALHNAAYHSYSEMDQAFLDLLHREEEEYVLLLPPAIEGVDDIMLASVACFGHALSVERNKKQREDFYRRLGSVENELGVYFMNRACTHLNGKADANLLKIQNLLAASQSHLEAGISAFSNVVDPGNLALVYSNSGRHMRIRAHLKTTDFPTRLEISKQENHYYNKAVSFYTKAIDLLGVRSANVKVWDSVYWELSTTFYSMACILQDYPTAAKNIDEAEREATDALHKSLKYCDVDTVGLKQPVYQFRAAKIHHRLASLHHAQYRRYCEGSKKKQILQLCRLHFDKASQLFRKLDNVSEALTIQMEHIGLDESLFNHSSTYGGKTKHLTHALELMTQVLPLIRGLRIDNSQTEQKTDAKTDEDGDDKNEIRILAEVMALLVQRLQQILLCMIKLSEKKPSVAETYRAIYLMAIACKPNELDVSQIAHSLVPILEQLSDLLSSHSNH